MARKVSGSRMACQGGIAQHSLDLDRLATRSQRFHPSGHAYELGREIQHTDNFQDPGFLDVVANKSPEVVRIYLPPDGNCLLSTMNHCLASSNYVNVVVADKQVHLQYLDMESAVSHCTKGIGIWDWCSNSEGVEPDVVMACCGDVSTQESLAATGKK